MQTRSMLKKSQAQRLGALVGAPTSRDQRPTKRSDDQDAEKLLHKLLLTLDSAAVVRAIKVLATDRQGRRCLQRESLWGRLVTKHFGGRRVQRSRSSRTSKFSDEDERSVTKNAGLSEACEGVKEFISRTEALNRFRENVLVVKGSIDEIKELGGIPIDGIALPTGGHLHHSGPRVAGTGSRRSDSGLANFVRGLTTTRAVGSAFVSPDPDSGVATLIHAVGPSTCHAQSLELLGSTYKSVMDAAQSHNMKCLAVAAISTGILGVPYKEGARVALDAIQQFLAQQQWTGVVGVVCYEQIVFEAFTEQKLAVMADMNAGDEC